MMMIVLTVIDAYSAGAAAHTEETAIFSISCAALGEEAIAVEEESLPGVGAHGNGGDRWAKNNDSQGSNEGADGERSGDFFGAKRIARYGIP